jgi:hypothetical protein
MLISSILKIFYIVMIVVGLFIPIYSFNDKDIIIYGILIFPVLLIIVQLLVLIILDNPKYKLILIIFIFFADRLGLSIISNRIISVKDKYGEELMFDNILFQTHFIQNIILAILFLFYLKKVVSLLAP